MAAEQPVVNIVGKQVAIGPIRDEHFADLNQWWNDYATVRNLGAAPAPVRPETTKGTFVDGILKDSTAVVFALYEVVSWRFIGYTGLLRVDHINRSAEFMIVIGEPDCRGKGYGTEAASLVLDHAFLAVGLASVMLRVSAYNPGGVRAYEKAGFKRAGVLRSNKMMGGKLWDTILMDILVEEFKSPVLRHILIDDSGRSPVVQPAN